MKKASIVCVGNELLNGQSVDTNSVWLSERLLEFNIPVTSKYIAADDEDLLSRSISYAALDADIVIITGGLGPTDDDITRQAFAKFLDSPLKLDNEYLIQIEQFFVKRNIHMPQKNKIQAYFPACSLPIPNNNGTAPGIFVQKNDKLFFVVPGVPREMMGMFDDFIIKHLRNISISQTVFMKKLKCFGDGESKIAEMLGSFMQRGRNPLINCTVSDAIITLYIIASAENEEKSKLLVEKDEKEIKNILGTLVYGYDGQTLAEVVGQKLTKLNKTLAAAESCTGGLLAKMLTDISGASRYFTYGWVTYANQAKISQLGVDPKIIEQFGAVSEQTAVAMAQGARKIAGTDYAIAITGIAGPDGGSEQKPVGLVYIALDSVDKTTTQRHIFSNNREFVRIRAAQTALNMLRLTL